MGGRGGAAPARGAAVLSVALLAAAVAGDQACRSRGLRDALLFSWSSLPFLVAIVAALVVGALVATRRPGHPVGWLIWALGLAILGSAIAESYAAVGLQRGSRLPAVGLVAGLANAAFVPWLTLLTAILAVTPSGRVTPRWPRRLLVLSATAGAAFFLARLVRPGRLDPPLHLFTNPMAVPGWAANAVVLVGGLAAVLVNAGLLTSVVLLARRYRRSRDLERDQLRWVAVTALAIVVMTPLPAVAVAVLPPAAADVVISLVVGLAITLLLSGIAAGVLGYRLYDVGRVLSVGTTYLVVTVLVAVVFAVMTVGLSELTNSPTSSSLRVAVSTTVAGCAAAGLRRRVQDTVDRRFHRRAFEATAVIRRFLAAPGPELDGAQRALRDATGDQSIRLGFPRSDAPAGYVTATGSPFVPFADPGRGTVSIDRGPDEVAVIEYDREASPAPLLASCGQLAVAELDNIRLRAELRGRLVEVEQSRARLAQSAAAERHRLERNLHDGAQQRLVAVMLSLRTTALRAERGLRITDELQAGIDGLGTAVRELRELANGLVPALLVREGLIPALVDLAARSPVPVLVDVDVPRLPEGVEETAYYVAAEGLANAMKHAGSSKVTICASIEGHKFAMEVRDDGFGGADANGTGLVGLADRARALGGELLVHSGAGDGTVVRLELPCGS